jgi:hypothetical protein
MSSLLTATRALAIGELCVVWAQGLGTACNIHCEYTRQLLLFQAIRQDNSTTLPTIGIRDIPISQVTVQRLRLC